MSTEDYFHFQGINLSSVKPHYNTFKTIAYQIVPVHLTSGVSSEGDISVLPI